MSHHVWQTTQWPGSPTGELGEPSPGGGRVAQVPLLLSSMSLEITEGAVILCPTGTPQLTLAPGKGCLGFKGLGPVFSVTLTLPLSFVLDL